MLQTLADLDDPLGADEHALDLSGLVCVAHPPLMPLLVSPQGLLPGWSPGATGSPEPGLTGNDEKSKEEVYDGALGCNAPDGSNALVLGRD
jgi:hypothetical protein